MATMRFIIMAPAYTEWSGGVIVLHKLCHILNQLGENAYLHPMVEEYPLSWKNHFIEIKAKIKLKYKSRKYKTNKMLQTPTINKLTKDDLENSIVVYPEIVSGNPLKAKNVVRWFLHHPGYQTGNVNYFSRELYFSYGAFGRDFKLYGSHTSDTVLHVFHQMNDIYNEIGASKERKGTAYCIRKGQGRKIIHDLSDSILIDEKKHEEVAEIFKRVKYFISYDLYTGYSLFAIMCGCIPIVVPDENLSLTEWQSDPKMRLGIAYGFEQIEEATKNRKAALDVVFEKENESILNVKKFIIESKEYFSIN